jgi:hypothetical protein
MAALMALLLPAKCDANSASIGAVNAPKRAI